jgi:ribosomal protein S18 acetylase RimI-like enzyme
MEIKTYDKFKVIKFSRNDRLNFNYINQFEGDFVICERHNYDFNSITVLEGLGFFFADRLITAEVSLDKISAEQAGLIRFRTSVNNDSIKDVNIIASLTFTQDRRFHFKRIFDMNFANKILPTYIKELLDDSTEIIVSYVKEEIVGFVFLRGLSDSLCEITLGAVHPKFQNLGVSVSLYIYTALHAASRGYEKLIGKISSVNYNSLNLFLFLGSRFIDSTDVYILEKNNAIK